METYLHEGQSVLRSGQSLQLIKKLFACCVYCNALYSSKHLATRSHPGPDESSPHLPKVHSNIIIPLRHFFVPKVCIYIQSHVRHLPHPSYNYLINLLILYEQYKPRSSSMRDFPQPPVTSALLGPIIYK